METLNIIIANNLKEIRQKKKLSLDKVASMTGVSKSMLGQIERGESNPTISTVWKIANGLHVSFTTLIKEPIQDNMVVLKDEVDFMEEDKGKYRAYPMFPYRDDQPFEVYRIEMDKGAYFEGVSHGEGSYEVVTVYSGELSLRLGEEEVIIPEGGGIRFRADQDHIYHNISDGMTKLNLVIYYKESGL